MRLRLPIFLVFLLSCIVAAYLGFKPKSVENPESPDILSNQDKALHVTVFFVVTTLFYWSIDAPRKRAVNTTVAVCCCIASIGTEILQHFLTSANRRFDPQDIAANLVGSIFATVISSLYHGRLNERRKRARYERMRQDVESAEPQNNTDMELAPIESDIIPSRNMGDAQVE